jgi:four helix bundle protein
MPVQALEELEVYCLAEEIADKWWQVISRWPPFAKDTVGKQLIRAIDSIGANIAESYGRYHFSDRINFLYYARGSLFESKFFIRRARERNLVADETFSSMMQDLQVLAPKLNAYIRSKKEQRKNA